jgi:hypothetical protein
MTDSVVLKVNGKEIRLNAFVQKALMGVIEGFLGALDDVPGTVKELEITVKK